MSHAHDNLQAQNQKIIITVVVTVVVLMVATRPELCCSITMRVPGKNLCV